MFIELTEDGSKSLIRFSEIILIEQSIDEEDEGCTIYLNLRHNDIPYELHVDESYEDVKKLIETYVGITQNAS